MVTISELGKIWLKAIKLIGEKVDDRNALDNFFCDSYIFDIKDNNAIIAAKGEVAVSVLNKTYKQIISDALLDVTGESYKITIIELDDAIRYAKQNNPTIISAGSFFEGSSLNPNYSFDNFVEGDSNKEAFQAANLAANNSGMFNPLFIYSNSGLGKTHLLHSIGNYMKHNRPNSKIICVTADDFINEYIKSAKGEKNLTEFRNYFNNCDALLIDDIQFMKSAEKCQECFYLIFNELDKSNKQIVITSDRNPKEINGIQDRLVTRFSKGLTVTIKKPDKQTSLAIIKKKIEADYFKGITFDELALVFIAEKFNNNVRDLEGALNNVLLQAKIKQDNHITIETVASALSIFGFNSVEKEITEQKIINVVADYYHLEPNLLTGKSHLKHIVAARHIAMYLIRTQLDTQFKKIGEAFGGKDHSSVMSAISKVENLLKTDKATKEAIETLKKTLSSK